MSVTLEWCPPRYRYDDDGKHKSSRTSSCRGSSDVGRCLYNAVKERMACACRLKFFDCPLGRATIVSNRVERLVVAGRALPVNFFIGRKATGRVSAGTGRNETVRTANWHAGAGFAFGTRLRCC